MSIVLLALALGVTVTIQAQTNYKELIREINHTMISQSSNKETLYLKGTMSAIQRDSTRTKLPTSVATDFQIWLTKGKYYMKSKELEVLIAENTTTALLPIVHEIIVKNSLPDELSATIRTSAQIIGDSLLSKGEIFSSKEYKDGEKDMLEVILKFDDITSTKTRIQTVRYVVDKTHMVFLESSLVYTPAYPIKSMTVRYITMDFSNDGKIWDKKEIVALSLAQPTILSKHYPQYKILDRRKKKHTP